MSLLVELALFEISLVRTYSVATCFFIELRKMLWYISTVWYYVVIAKNIFITDFLSIIILNRLHQSWTILSVPR